MSRYDGLIIPRSYSEYINKTDAATLLQALQLSGVMDNVPTADSNHPVKSNGVYTEFLKSFAVEDLYGQYGNTYDLNNLITTENFKLRAGRVYNNTNNFTQYHLPAKDWNVVIWVPLTASGSYGVQIAFRIVEPAAIYKRSKINETWGAWSEV